VIRYIDTSAYLKLLVDESESAMLKSHLQTARADGYELVSSILLETELRRAGHRLGIAVADIESELSKLDIISIDDSTFIRAGNFPDPLLRSLDALHLAAAIECAATAIYTYDARQASAAQNAGIQVLAPSGAQSS
jgi:uncharacterized protein